MAEQEQDGIGSGMDTGGGAISQEELDALLAAVEGEHGGAETAAEPEGWADETPEAETADAPPRASTRAVVDLPSFDLPGANGGNGLGGAGGSGGSMSRVRDIPLDVSVELGRTRLLIRDILDLGAGSIIELDKLAGEPVDLFANGLLVARGEVIVIDDNFGVRVTEIITAAERRHIQEAEADALAA